MIIFALLKGISFFPFFLAQASGAAPLKIRATNGHHKNREHTHVSVSVHFDSSCSRVSVRKPPNIPAHPRRGKVK